MNRRRGAQGLLTSRKSQFTGKNLTGQERPVRKKQNRQGDMLVIRIQHRSVYFISHVHIFFCWFQCIQVMKRPIFNTSSLYMYVEVFKTEKLLLSSLSHSSQCQLIVSTLPRAAYRNFSDLPYFTYRMPLASRATWWMA